MTLWNGMRKASSTCANFGKCGRAGMPAPEGTRSCPECGEELVATSAGKFPMVPVVAGFLVLGVIVTVLALAARRNLVREADHTVSAASISGGTNAFLGTEYFPEGRIATLMQHAEKGKLEVVRQLLASQPELLGERGKGGITPLHAALFSKEATAYRTLLKAGFDPDMPADNGITPLMAATFHQDSSFLEAALDKAGKLPTRKDVRGRDALFLAVASRRISNVRLLLANGADPNAKDTRGNSVLMASLQGRRPDKEIVRLLLSAGVDTKVTDATGLGAKDFAATFQDPELLALLP